MNGKWNFSSELLSISLLMLLFINFCQHIICWSSWTNVLWLRSILFYARSFFLFNFSKRLWVCSSSEDIAWILLMLTLSMPIEGYRSPESGELGVYKESWSILVLNCLKIWWNSGFSLFGLKYLPSLIRTFAAYYTFRAS